MSIKIGVHDFFAYTIPGLIHILVFTIQAHVYGLTTFNMSNLDLSLGWILLATLVAYVVGQLLDTVSANVLPRIYDPKGSNGTNVERAMQKMKIDYGSRLTASTQLRDWPVLYMYVKQRSENVAERIDAFNAQGIMLRNISFALLLLGVGLLIHQLVALSLEQFLFSILSFVFSIVAFRRARRVGGWFYSSIYEAAIAYSLDVSTFVRLVSADNNEVHDATNPRGASSKVTTDGN